MPRRLKNAEQTAKNWVGGMQTAGQAYKDGVDAVMENPLAKAADASDRYLAGVQAGNDKRVAKLRAISLEQWKQSARDKGAARLGSGASASQSRYQRAMATLLPYQQQVLDSLPPRGTFDQNLARFDAYARGMKAFKDTYRG